MLASLLFGGAALGWAGAVPGEVYLVLGSDTGVWNAPGGVAVAEYHSHFKPDLFTLPQGNAYRVIDPGFRGQFSDSYGQPLKLTWWMLVGSVYGASDNTDVPLPNLMSLYLMNHYHGDTLRQLGDEVSLHYHTFLWSDYNADGVFYWNEARSFHECRADFDLALAQSLIEEEVFPVSFRSGWHYMDNEWQQYLNQLLPYSMDDDSPHVQAWYTNEPIYNVLDWSQAPTTFIPYHPASTNYQVPGDGAGWNVRSVKLVNVTQTMMDAIFASAAGGTNQVVSLWSHLPEATFPADLVQVDALVHGSASSYPTVMFRYCTAVEAMQRWLGTIDHSPPELEVLQTTNGETVSLELRVNEPIFQPQPFVAVKDIYQQYRLVPGTLAATNDWVATLPVARSHLAKVGIAVTDLAGNLTTRILRYLPDDLYLDNLDPAYSETAGPWQSTNNAAWGVDARVVRLVSGATVRAQWTLPITASGPYSLFVQVPSVSVPATNVSFEVRAAGSNIASAVFTSPLPAHQWVYLGTPTLDPSVTNVVEMSVSGQGQTNALAVADVLKVSPLVWPLPGFITNVVVEVGDTTANITWTTIKAATSFAAYGPTATWGHFSETNSSPDTVHVVSLTGLTPGQGYSYQLTSIADEVPYTYQGAFTTASVAPTTSQPIFGITNTWRYTSDNLDTVPGWRQPTFDDSGWPSGPGLLWVDTRTTGQDPAVQPKNTPMPGNPATGLPFRTYYFRTHFSLTNVGPGATLSFSNYVDDGAAFYLNGAEIHRLNLAPAPASITNATLARGYTCAGDATCPVLFTISGTAMTNLVAGDNVLAVEVHNYSADSPDITFGSAVFYSSSTPASPRLEFVRSAEGVTLYWNGSGVTLQQATKLGPNGADWTDVPGPITSSPYAITNAATSFYRLRY